jgi:hypothetical protein
MSIAYAEPLVESEYPSAIFRPTSPATKFAVSAIFLVAAGSTTAGVPIREPIPVVRGAAAIDSLAEELPERAPATDAELVRWIKDQSGLTWDQVARSFDVSRRAVHLWASGGRVSAGNAEALQTFAALVRGSVGATTEETRAVLLAVGSDGLSPIDRFRRAQHDASGAVTGAAFDPIALLGEDSGRDQQGS